MKKLLIVLFSIMLLVGCSLDGTKKEAIEFKNDYESLNGTTTSNGKERRSLTINKNNPYVKVSQDEVVKMIENNETFYLYVGDKLCPWCRSVIEKSIEVANKHNIDKIYYIDIWDDNGNEIFRDKYELQEVNKKLKPVKVQDGTEAYYKLLTHFDSLLRDYTLTKDDKTYEVNEKRIYAPNYFYIKDGKAVKITTAKSDKLNIAYDELTEDILKDQESLFNEFFNN